MFHLLPPRPPLETDEKTWVEWGMRWLCGRFGARRLRSAEVLLPDEDFLPRFEGDPGREARDLFDRIAAAMGARSDQLDLEIVEDFQLPGAAGHYDGGSVVRVALSQLARPESLVATLAHELAHHLLVGGGHIDPRDPDHEGLADLTTVFLGAGVFGANASLYSHHEAFGTATSWTIGRQGYLPARMFGYGLALFAVARGEDRPDWMWYLRRDAAEACRKGIEYVRRTGDTLFGPDAEADPGRAPTVGEIFDRLQDRSATVRLCALRDMSRYDIKDQELAPLVADLLRDRDRSIPPAAARALGGFTELTPRTAESLVRALHSSAPGLRAGAAEALGRLRLDAGGVVPELAAVASDDPSAGVVIAACGALASFGNRADTAVPSLLRVLEWGLIEGDARRFEAAAAALAAVTPSARAAINEHFGDPELRSLALEVLREVRAGI